MQVDSRCGGLATGCRRVGEMEGWRQVGWWAGGLVGWGLARTAGVAGTGRRLSWRMALGRIGYAPPAVNEPTGITGEIRKSLRVVWPRDRDEPEGALAAIAGLLAAMATHWIARSWRPKCRRTFAEAPLVIRKAVEMPDASVGGLPGVAVLFSCLCVGVWCWTRFIIRFFR